MEITPIEKKIIIMKEYIAKTGEPIKTKTIYKGYRIGNWKDNLRASDKANRLSISPELRKEFEKIGVLGVKIKRDRKTDKEKYEMIMEFINENPDVKVSSYTVDKYGNCIGTYKNTLQHSYNIGKISLSSEEIEQLKENEIINLRPKDVKAASKKYQMSTQAVRYITKQYSQIDKFVSDYKSGNIQLSEDEIRKIGIIEPNIITICNHDISIGQKMQYVKFVERLLKYSKGKIDFSQIESIDLDELESAMQRLKAREREILIKRNGLNGEKKETLMQVAQEYGLNTSRINCIEMRSVGKLSQPEVIESFVNIKDKGTKRQQIICEYLERLKKIAEQDSSSIFQAEKSQLEEMLEIEKSQYQISYDKADKAFQSEHCIFDPEIVVPKSVSYFQRKSNMKRDYILNDIGLSFELRTQKKKENALKKVLAEQGIILVDTQKDIGKEK